MLKKNLNQEIKKNATEYLLPTFDEIKKKHDILAQLISNGDTDVNAQTIYGDTPAHLAAREDDIDCFERLLLLAESGANLSIKNNTDRTPMEEADETIKDMEAKLKALKTIQERLHVIYDPKKQQNSSPVKLTVSQNPYSLLSSSKEKYLPIDNENISNENQFSLTTPKR